MKLKLDMTTESLSEHRSIDDEMTLKDLILKIRCYYTYLASKRFVIFSIAIVGAICGLAYAMLKKPIYTATTTFVLEAGESSGGLGNYANLASMVGLDIGVNGGGMFEGDNILELYKSRKMIEKALLTEVNLDEKRDLLVNRFIEINNLQEKWAKRSDLKNIRFSKATIGKANLEERPKFDRLQDSVLGAIVKEVSTRYLVVSKPDKKLSIFSAEVKSTDELFAKAFNDQIVRTVSDFYIQTKTKKFVENIEILQQKTDSVRAVMNGDIYRAAAVSDATPNLNPTRLLQRTAPIQRSQFSSETNKAILGELVKNLEVSKISLRKGTPLIQVIDTPILPLERDKSSKVKSIVIGGILAVFFTVLWLMARKTLSVILTD